MSATLSLSKVLKSQAGWYRGDFHVHTTFSDGYYSPAELVEVARHEGLDFVVVTDHNTIDAYAHFGDPSDLVVIPGVEVTLKIGHFNVFGVEGTPDWITANIRSDPNRPVITMTELMQQTSSAGLLNSINHPLLRPWDWQDASTDLSYVHCLEIYNDPSWPENKLANPQATTLWTQWLNTGYRITAIGGSDFHQPEPEPGQNKPSERLGIPATVVYAGELSGAAILAGARQGRVYITMGPLVAFQVRANGQTYTIGADLGELDGLIEIEGRVSCETCPALVQLVKNGRIIDEVALEDGQANLKYSDEVKAAVPTWYRLDVLGQEQQILAITNPIFVGPQRRPSAKTYGAFVDNLTEVEAKK
jgi:hypothetical protein